MKIKILNNIIHKGKIMNTGEVHDVKDREADSLIEAEHAVEHVEPKQQEQQQQKTPPPPTQ